MEETEVSSAHRNRRAKIAVGIGALAIAAISGVSYLLNHQPLTEITGVVLRQDKDPAQQPPIPGAYISLADGLSVAPALSDSTGLFHLRLRQGVTVGQSAMLTVRHADYRPGSIFEVLQRRIYVVHMVPLTSNEPPGKPQTVGDIKIRYSVKTPIVEDVGTAVKSFEVVNLGDIPCERHFPCSPDGRWRATIGGATLDAVEGTQFRNARATCIAGPCPFTKIENDGFSNGGRRISVTFRDWSDTASFVLEADVIRDVNSEMTRSAFAITFNQVLSFTLPVLAQGPSIEATVNGQDIVYPLGPALKLDWAVCDVTITKDKTQLFHCELKPGYRFS